MCKKLFLAAIAALLPLSANASRPQVQFFAAGNYSHILGYMQVPEGGVPGTASFREPRFSALGMNDLLSFSVGGQVSNQWLGLFGNYQYLRPRGHKTTQTGFIFHNIDFPSGTPITTRAQFDLFQFGLNHNFFLCQHSIGVVPALALAILDFSARLTAEERGTNRYFYPISPQVGGSLVYYVSAGLNLTVNGMTSIPGVTSLMVNSLQGLINYTLYHSKNMDVAVFSGIGYQKIKYRDKQSLPNSLSFTQAPMGTLGLTLSF